MVKTCKSKKYPELSCGQIKDESLFNKESSLCKDCQKKYKKLYYEQNKLDIKEDQKIYRLEHKEEKQAYDKIYYEENKIEIKEYNEQYNILNKDEIKDQKKQYNINNKPKVNASKNKWKKAKKETDPCFALRLNVSRAVNKSLHANGFSKNGQSIMQYLDYTMEDLKKHLEAQFEPWMSWDNHGQYIPNEWDDNNSSTWKWQLDHIIPQSDLPYASMEDKNFKKAWSLDNLRPLSAKQNCLDGVSRTRHQNVQDKSTRGHQ